MPRFLTILQFWFDELNGNPDKLEKCNQVWFGKSPQTDQFMREYFLTDLNAAIAGEYDEWADGPEGRLALIILFDQFSRNLFRHTPKAYAQDDRALALAKKDVSQKSDLSRSIYERIFVYMPFAHAEDSAVQMRSVKLFAKLLDDAPKNVYPYFKITYDFAIAHQKVIEQFGRFPHRNKILGRQSTPEEVIYLQKNPSGF